jgi:hypothetical protein
MGWQRRAHRLLALVCPGRRLGVGRHVGFGCAGAGVFGGSILFERADQQFKLLNIAIELLRGTAEPRTPQHGQLHLQLLDVQRLGMDLGGVGGNLDVLARQFGLQVCGEDPQNTRVGRQRLGCQRHRQILRNRSVAPLAL